MTHPPLATHLYVFRRHLSQFLLHFHPHDKESDTEKADIQSSVMSLPVGLSHSKILHKHSIQDICRSNYLSTTSSENSET